MSQLDSNLETAAWGALLVSWGASELLSFVPPGTGALSTGLILLGLNAVRWRKGIPTRGLTTILGILALVWGAVDLASSLLRPPLDLPTFAILTIALGLILLVRVLVPGRDE